MKMRFSLVLITVALAAGGASAQVKLSFQKKVSLSAITGIGSNPSAIAWNGTSAFVGGFNASGATANTGVVRIDNVLGTPTTSSVFGTLSTANNRGITQMAVRGGTLAVAWDNGAGSGDSIRTFNTSNNTLIWRVGTSAADSTRRGDAVGFDPGFNGADATPDVSYLSIGSGRRHRLSDAAGTYTDGQNGGAIINFAPVSTNWRSMAFDPTTGDLYTRESNRIGKAVRTADNAFQGNATSAIGGLTSFNAVGQGISFVNSTEFGKFLIVNDRTSVAGGQAFTSVIKAFTTTGTQQTVTYINGFTAPADGNGYYDFSFDAATQSLAILDFTNRDLYVFNVTATASAPEPGTLALMLLGGGAGMAALVRRRRSA